MTISTPVTADRLKHHFTYNLWKYALSAALIVFGWSLVYQTTAYRPPNEKKIEVYIRSATADSDTVDAFLKPIWEEATPDMEAVSSLVLMTTDSDDYYANMQMTTYLYAGEGDIYIMPTADFKSYATSGAFLALENLIENGQLDVTGIDLTNGYVSVLNEETGVYEKHLYGIPLDTLDKYVEGMNINNRGMMMSILITNGNDENVIPFMNALIQAGRTGEETVEN